MGARELVQITSKLTHEFETRSISEECPYCHKDNWFIMDWGRGKGNYVKSSKQVVELGSPFIRLTCANCGNIRFIDPEVLGLSPETTVSETDTAGKDDGQQSDEA